MKVFCLGNMLHSDDGIAMHLLKDLRKLNHDFVEVGNSVSCIKLPDERAVFIDAVHSGRHEEGEVLVIHRSSVVGFVDSRTSHDFYLKDVMREKDVLIGIVVKNTCFGDELSPGLKSRYDSILKRVVYCLTKNF